MRLTGFWGKTAYATMGAKANQMVWEVAKEFNPIFRYDGDAAWVSACKKMRGLGAEHSYCLTTSPDDMSAVELADLVERIERCQR